MNYPNFSDKELKRKTKDELIDIITELKYDKYLIEGQLCNLINETKKIINNLNIQFKIINNVNYVFDNDLKNLLKEIVK